MTGVGLETDVQFATSTDSNWPRAGTASFPMIDRFRCDADLEFSPFPTFKFECPFRKKVAGSRRQLPAIADFELPSTDRTLTVASPRHAGHRCWRTVGMRRWMTVTNQRFRFAASRRVCGMRGTVKFALSEGAFFCQIWLWSA